MDKYIIEYKAAGTDDGKNIECDNLETAIDMVRDLIECSDADNVTLRYSRKVL